MGNPYLMMCRPIATQTLFVFEIDAYGRARRGTLGFSRNEQIPPRSAAMRPW